MMLPNRLDCLLPKKLTLTEKCWAKEKQLYLRKPTKMLLVLFLSMRLMPSEEAVIQSMAAVMRNVNRL